MQLEVSVEEAEVIFYLRCLRLAAKDRVLRMIKTIKHAQDVISGGERA